MAKHKETPAKQTIRLLLRDACERLQRGGLTYLGLPAEEALDLKALDNLITNAICIAEKQATLEETRRSIAGLPLKERKFVCADMWQYLRTTYPTEPLVADITFLDFYGGGIKAKNPFAEEIQGLRSLFAKHALHPNRAFVLGWFFMPRDQGKEPYVTACQKIVPEADLAPLKAASGVLARAIAVRLLLRQSLIEHGMSASVFQHALYKKAMNTIIVVYSKGNDPRCRLNLGSPDNLMAAPIVQYDGKSPVPQLIPITES